jgi:hypothetical protein
MPLFWDNKFALVFYFARSSKLYTFPLFYIILLFMITNLYICRENEPWSPVSGTRQLESASRKEPLIDGAHYLVGRGEYDNPERARPRSNLATLSPGSGVAEPNGWGRAC